MARRRSAAGTEYVFAPATRGHLPMLRSWLRSPEAVRWWGEPREQEALLVEDFDAPAMAMWIVSYQGGPFAYAQDYDAHSWPQPQFAGLPAGTRCIDAFIGEPEMLGVGHGSAFLRQHAERLIRDGAPLVAIDPDPVNLRARQAYRKAGFVGEAKVGGGEGPVVLMTFPSSGSCGKGGRE